MEAVKFNAAFLTALICGVAFLGSVIADPDGASESKPHFLYMKRLRKHLADSHIALPDTMDQDSSDQGQLVATSIESLNAEGKGYSGNGFFFEDGNGIKLNFTIPRQVTSGDIPDVDLWMFPDKSHVTSNKIYVINFLVFATILGANNPKRDQFSVLWDTNEDCIALNLTDLSRKISRSLNKKKLNESIVTLDVQVGAVFEQTEIQEDAVRALNRDLCSSLAPRQTNNSFLIIKNYNEETVPRLTRPSRRRRQTNQETDNGEIAQISTNSSDSTPRACGVVPLIVNLTETYGNFIKEPEVTDIKDCSGRCSLNLDEKVFSKHGEIKERLKLLPGREYLSSHEPICTPIKFRPLHLLIGLKDKSEVIVQISDLVVDRCACQ